MRISSALIVSLGLLALVAGCSGVDVTCPPGQVFDENGLCALPCELVTVNCDDANDCTADDCANLQDETAECSNVPAADDTTCTEDGIAGWCVSGQCDFCAKVSCDDANDCTADGQCDPTNGNCPDKTPQPSGTACGEGGVCDGDGECLEPEKVCDPNPCNDDKQCTQDTCQSSGAGPTGYECTYPPLGRDAPCAQGSGEFCDGIGNCVECNSSGQCDDGNQCTEDTCLGSVCAHTESSANTPCNQEGGNFCDGLGNCVECNRSEQCPHDGNPCTNPLCDTRTCGTEDAPGTCDFNGGLGVCQGGVCVDGNKCNVDPYPCEDRGPCVDDICAPATGLCTYSNSSNGKTCTLASVGGECLDGVCNLCVAIICDDNNRCTEDGVCNPSTGNCDGAGFEPINTPCGDGVCDGAGQCVDCNNDPQCNDGVECTDDRCLNNSCSNEASAVDSPCTVGGSYCDNSGNCVECNQSGQCPDDGNVCTAAICVTQSCTSDNLDGSSCVYNIDQAGICSGDECIDANKCLPYICEDRGQCVDDSCNRDNGVCSYDNAPSSRSCTVGQYSGQCSNGVCDLCATVVCDDGNPCKIFGTCNPSNGQCQPPPQNKPDGTACGGVGQVCVSGVCANDAIVGQYYSGQGPFNLDFAANYMWGLQGFYLNFLGSGTDHNIRKALAGFFPNASNTTLWVRYEDRNADDAYSWSLHTRKLPIGSTLGFHAGQSTGGRVYTSIGPCPDDKVPVLRGFYVYRQSGTDANLRDIAVGLYAARDRDQVDVEVIYQDESPGEDYWYQVSYALVPTDRVIHNGTITGNSTGSVRRGVPSSQQPMLRGFDLRFTNGDHNIDQLSVQMLVPNELYVRFNDQNNDDPFSYKVWWVDLQ